MSGDFGFDSTTDEVLSGIDLDGRIALVTGASGGLGEETARALAAHGAHVVMTARDLPKGKAAAERIRSSTGNPNVEVTELELGVLQHFSGLKEFHAVFSSCNRNFHLDGPRMRGRWCGDCPKCRFAALGLALFLSPEEVVAIQGRDLLDEPRQEKGFRELCGLGLDKPFECVGEASESRAALVALGRSLQWRDHIVVRALQPELEQLDVPAVERLLEPLPRHFIPAALCKRLGLPESADG